MDDTNGTTATLFIIVGPAGFGKTVLVKALTERIPELTRVATATTRPMRAGEVLGRDYYFFSSEEFENHIRQGDFIEWNLFAGYKYGTLRAPIQSLLDAGKSQIMSIDIHGVAVLKKTFPNIIGIFVIPPSFEVLKERMLVRAQNTPEHMAEKLEIAKEEMKHQNEFDHVVVNDVLETAIQEIVEIVKRYL